MNRVAVAELIARRGNLIGWMHSVIPPPGAMNPSSDTPKATLGGPRLTNTGNFGESFLPPVNVFAYFSSKTTSFTQQPFGQVDIGDAQLDFAVPFFPRPGTTVLVDPDPTADPPILGTTPSLTDYNSGNFSDIKGEATLRMDRFVIMGQLWTAKARAIPLVDKNVLFAWRLLISKVSV
jgi:hypothetical protein